MGLTDCLKTIRFTFREESPDIPSKLVSLNFEIHKDMYLCPLFATNLIQ